MNNLHRQKAIAYHWNEITPARRLEILKEQNITEKAELFANTNYFMLPLRVQNAIFEELCKHNFEKEKEKWR